MDPLLINFSLVMMASARAALLAQVTKLEAATMVNIKHNDMHTRQQH
jgi:hypothetical protein